MEEPTIIPDEIFFNMDKEHEVRERQEAQYNRIWNAFDKKIEIIPLMEATGLEEDIIQGSIANFLLQIP